LWLLPNTEIIEVDVYDGSSITRQLSGCDAVINLAGILNEKGDDGSGFRRVHTELTRVIVKACFDAGVKRYLHMSALNADPFGPSYYLRTKGEAENAAMAAHDEGLPATVFRPSVIFGPNDDFFNRFARLLRISPLLFPLACARAKFQPVFIGDVSEAIVRALTDRSTFGGRYDLGGPEVKTLLEIVQYVADLSNKRTIIVPLGPVLSKLQANVLEYVPGKPLSRDNLRSTSEDSVCRGESGLVQLGIEPASIGEIVPTYLGGKFERMRYYDLRSAARRIP
jgi:NADH dehydrogenase